MTSVSTDRRFGVNVGRAIKVPVKAATTANITLSGTQTIDGVAVVTDDRVLVKNQTTGSENGIYLVDTGAWERAPDWDGSYDVGEGTIVYVTDGTVAAGLFYVVTTADPITIGTTSVSLSVVSPSSPLTIPLPVAQGGTGASTAANAAGALGLVQVTGEAGTANAQTGTIPSGVTAFATDQLFIFVPSVANTSSCTLTLTPSGGGALAAKNIFTNGAALVGGELQLGVSAILQYDGTQLNVIGHVGPRPIPQNSQSVAYTTVIADANKHILHPTADNNPRTFTIDSNANVPYPVGTAITFVNEINTLTIAITSDTLVLAGAATTGSRTLAAMSIATALKKTATSWIISGVGLT